MRSGENKHFRLPLLATATMLVILIVGFHSYHLSDLPEGKHTWAQSDYYATTVGFVNNGLDFFHPETYHLNSTGAVLNQDSNGITAIDFPIHYYMAAVIMKLLGTKSAFIYRLYALLIGLTGLLIYYRSMLRYLGQIQAFCLACLIYLIPVYNYYFTSFLPGSLAFSHFLAGLGLFFKYFDTRKLKDLVLTLTLWTLAALIRFPFVIPIIALACLLTLESIIYKKLFMKKLAMVSGGLLVVGIYFLYNTYLRNTYGSEFLAHPVLVDDYAQFIEVAKEIVVQHLKVYITPFHLLLLVIPILARKVDNQNRPFIYFLSIFSFGVFLYSLLMFKQFYAHDYYWIDTGLPVVSTLLTYIATRKNILIKSKKWTTTLIFFTIGAIVYNAFFFTKRYAFYDERPTKISQFKEGKSLLKDRHIDKMNFAVIYSGGRNVPFIGLERKGIFLLEKDIKNNPDTVLSVDYIMLLKHNSERINLVNYSILDSSQYTYLLKKIE